MEQTSQQPSMMSHAIRWGVILGGIAITFTVLLYAIDYTWMVQLKFLFIALAIYLGITIYAGINYRNSIGGFLPYGKAFVHGFTMLAISALVATLFNLVMYNVIDTELPQKLTDAAIENTRSMMESMGAPEDTIEVELEKARERTANQYTIGGQALGYVFILVFSAIMALISAIFVRKNEPVEM